MVHPQPSEAWRAAWFAWLIGKPYEYAALPPLKPTNATKANRVAHCRLPPFQMLTALNLDGDAWAQIAKNGSWQQVRQNLNTFARHRRFDKDKHNKDSTHP